MSNNGTTNKIGKRAYRHVHHFIRREAFKCKSGTLMCGFYNAIPLAAPLTPALPHGKYIKNQAKTNSK